MKYSLSIYNLEMKLIPDNKIANKTSNNYNDLKDLIEKYKDERGKQYQVEVSSNTGYVGDIERDNLFEDMVDNKIVEYYEKLKLNSDIEKLV
ncbi:hypothetical protein IM156_11840 [Staphylococcus epidermidis]|nr:hypothetical protein [Staphylococcus epidermidis]